MISPILTTFSDALFISLFSIVIVFAILTLISLSIHSLQYIRRNPKPIQSEVIYQPKKPFNIADVKDDDMMVALLVASIDHYETTKQDVNIISIKEIRTN